jgi:hypothetical protein
LDAHECCSMPAEPCQCLSCCELKCNHREISGPWQDSSVQSLVPKTNAASISPQGLVLDRGSSLICMRAGTPNRIRVAACVGVARARGRVCVCICVGRVWSSGRWVAGRVRVWCWWRWGEGVVGVGGQWVGRVSGVACVVVWVEVVCWWGW